MRPRPRMHIRVIAEAPFNDLGHGGRKRWAHAMRPYSVLTSAGYASAMTTKAAHGANTVSTRNDSYIAAGSFGSDCFNRKFFSKDRGLPAAWVRMRYSRDPQVIPSLPQAGFDAAVPG